MAGSERHSGLRRAMVLVFATIAALIASAGALGAPPPPAAGTPLLGQSLLSADQLAGWYASTGIASRSPTDVGTLAALFVDEGAAQGVRADLAFAQSMLETGYLRFGGQVRPSDNNFSGLGACDSCPRGLAFPTAQLGVRAQIQHLWAYATPGADPALLARPLVSPRFHLVQPPGKAPLWEAMGGGNWATDPLYADKVLRIWRSMLAWAGVPEPAPSVGDARPLIVRTAASGAANLGGWPLRRGALAMGIRRLGTPDRLVRAAGTCLARWTGIGAAVQVAATGADPCEATTATARWARLAGPTWRTQRGLAVGDTAARMRALYPRARLRGGRWWLVSGREAGRGPVPRLRAEVRSGRVAALWVDVRR